MSILLPYKRTVRQFTDGHYEYSGKGQYIFTNGFAQNPQEYIRPLFIIQKDLQTLFDYIESCDDNLKCYSFRIHELLFRCCVEVESNFKAILSENGYSKNGDWNMNDYKKVEASHLLSGYEVGMPIWKGSSNIRKPFEAWANNKSLDWYNDYHDIKHSRTINFHKANLDNLINAVCGYVVLLSAQFCREDFIPSSSLLAAEGSIDGMETAVGGYFRVKFPNWPSSEQYDFTHHDIDASGFQPQNYPYK